VLGNYSYDGEFMQKTKYYLLNQYFNIFCSPYRSYDDYPIWQRQCSCRWTNGAQEAHYKRGCKYKRIKDEKTGNLFLILRCKCHATQLI